jgi:hypothetical protein
MKVYWVPLLDCILRLGGFSRVTALKPLRPYGLSAYQRYGHFFRTPIFGILVKIEEKYFIVYMEFIL